MNQQKRYEAEFLQLFNTHTKISGYAKDKESFTQTAQDIYNQLEEYHKLYDIYNNYDGINNLKTINDNAGKQPVKVDSRIIDMLLFAKEGVEFKENAFNPAMGSVLKIWHEYRTNGIENPENAALPSFEELYNASLHADFNNVIIDKKESTVFLTDPLMSLDVGAVAKGYAVEQIALKIENDKQSKDPLHLLLSVGGNVRTVGEKPAKEALDRLWTVGIKSPFEEESEPLAYLKLSDSAVVTSGIYERFYTVDDIQYHHIIDPKTLFPAKYFVSVTVVCPDSGLADILSTVLFTISLQEGKDLLKEFENTEAVWVMEDRSVHYSDNFADLISK